MQNAIFCVVFSNQVATGMYKNVTTFKRVNATSIQNSLRVILKLVLQLHCIYAKIRLGMNMFSIVI